MHEVDILAGGVDLVSAVPRRFTRRASVAENPVIVGFDTEWRTSDRRLISVQFAMRTLAGLVSKVFYPRERRLTPVLLAQLVDEFLAEHRRVPVVDRGRRRLYLVSHFAAAEIAMFEDAFRDLDIMQIGKAHHARLPDLFDGDQINWSFKIIDLFAYYPVALADVGAAIGLPKFDVDPSKLDQLLTADRAAFERYASRDAEIPVEAFERLRQSMLADWGIDPLFVPSLPALASNIFRRHFLTRSPVPTKTAIAAVTRRSRAGDWRTRPVKYLRYAGPEERRRLACRAYWGGRGEAFVRGLVEGPVVERDVVSLYPHAALLQALPNERTKWKRVTSVGDIEGMEGFGTFEFAFPRTETYPCLPVHREGGGRMVFPLQGTSSCTFAEVRAALALGASVEVVEAWGFEPSVVEREHDLANYIREFLAKKAVAKAGTLEYETSKLLLNALIGKLAERRGVSHVLDVERAARKAGAPGLGRILARSGALRGVLKGNVGVGSLWVPEWATLIVGRARAIMASIVAKGALVVSTDAVLVARTLGVESEGLAALHAVGSDIAEKYEGDALFVARSRMYAILQRADHVRAPRVLARDARWAVIRVARHGTTESKEQFAETVLACLAAGRDAAPVRQKLRLASAETAVREGREINEEIIEERKTKFGWDSKRRLLNRDVNLFRSFTDTRPYFTLGKIEGAEHQRSVRTGPARVVRRGRHDVEAVLELLRAGRGVREVARKTGVPRSTVSDLNVARTRAGFEAAWPAVREELEDADELETDNADDTERDV